VCAELSEHQGVGRTAQDQDLKDQGSRLSNQITGINEHAFSTINRAVVRIKWNNNCEVGKVPKVAI
jgi:hypothetical protein